MSKAVKKGEEEPALPIKKPRLRMKFRPFSERLAATYSRRTYRTTTIGKTVFDGRVRNGIGSDHSFMATKNRWSVKSVEAWSVKTDRNSISFDAHSAAFKILTQSKNNVL